jgi:hypothetical protein
MSTFLLPPSHVAFLEEHQRSVLVLMTLVTTFRLPPSHERFLEEHQRSVLALKSRTLLETSPKVLPIDTRAEVARTARVSDNTISKVKVIEAKATPAQKAKLVADIQAWEERRALAKAFKGNQHISAPSPFVNSQNTTRELAKSLKVGEQTALDEDTYAPMDLFDWLGIIKALKAEGLTQEKIGEKIGWSTEKVKQHSALLTSIVTKVLQLALAHQQGRVTEEVTTVTFDFTEGWFRNSGLYELWPCYQYRVMAARVPGALRVRLWFRGVGCGAVSSSGAALGSPAVGFIVCNEDEDHRRR